MPTPLLSRRARPLTGTPRVPGDKSISHRALILGGLAVGESLVEGLLEGEDVLATAEAMRAFGCAVARGLDAVWRRHGRGVFGLARKSVVQGRSEAVRVDLGGRRDMKTKKKKEN